MSISNRPTMRGDRWIQYREQELIGGANYTCKICKGSFSGGHHLLLTDLGNVRLVCPACWPRVLEWLEKQVLAGEGREL